MHARDESQSDEAPKLRWMVAAVGLSALGMAFHTVREFGYAGLLSLGTGTIPFVGVQVVLVALWWRVRPARTVVGRALAVTGVIQLLGGAIISVLPLPFLPFQPEQSGRHYLTHLVYGLAQLPLIVVPLYQAGRRRSNQSGA